MAVSRSRPLPSSNRTLFSSDLLGSFNYRWSTTLITLWALLEETPRHRVSVKYSTWGVWQPGRQAGQPGSDWNRIVNVMPAMWHENGGENKCITFNGVWEERPRDCQNGRRISSQVLTQRHWTMGYDDESYGPLSWIICGLSSVHSQTISEMSRAVTVRHTSSDIENTEGLHCEIWRLFFRQMFMDYNNLSCRLVSADGHGLGSIK